MLHTCSTGSPHSCVQLTGMQLPYMRTPQSQVSDPGAEPGTYFPWRTKGRGKRRIQHVFSQNKLHLTHYTHIFMPK